MNVNPVTIELASHSILTLAESKGALLQCLEGTVWITEEHSRDDYVLEAGKCHELLSNGRAVVQAMGVSRIAVSAVGLSGRDRRPLALRRLLAQV